MKKLKSRLWKVTEEFCSSLLSDASHLQQYVDYASSSKAQADLFLIRNTHALMLCSWISELETIWVDGNDRLHTTGKKNTNWLICSHVHFQGHFCLEAFGIEHIWEENIQEGMCTFKITLFFLLFFCWRYINICLHCTAGIDKHRLLVAILYYSYWNKIWWFF